MTRYSCVYQPIPPAPLLPRWRGRRELGDERVITCRRGNLLCALPKVPFATWQGWLNSYIFSIIDIDLCFVRLVILEPDQEIRW